MDKMLEAKENKDLVLHLDVPQEESKIEGRTWNGRFVLTGDFLRNHGLELVIGMVISVAMWWLSIPFGMSLIGFAGGLFSSILVLIVVDHYDYMPARKLMLVVENFNEKFPQARVISLLFSVVFCYYMPMTAVAFAFTTGTLSALGMRKQEMLERLTPISTV